MPLPKNLARYRDIEETLSQALKTSGGVLTFPDKKSAMHWRVRANYYRKLLREAGDGTSPYDLMVMRWNDLVPNQITIDMDVPPLPQFTPNEEVKETEPEEELPADIIALRKKLLGGGLLD